MIWQYLAKIIKKIGTAKIIFFIILLIIGYLIYFSQPYLITQLFISKVGSGKQLCILILLDISLMMIPLIPFLNNNFIQAVRRFSKEELWLSITNKPFDYFIEHPVGRVQNYIKDVSFACRELEQSGLKIVVQMFVMLTLYTFMLSKNNIYIGIIYLLFFTSYMLISVKMAKANRHNIAKSLKSAANVNEYIIDYYQNIETVLSLKTKDYENKKMDKILSKEQDTYKRVQGVTNNASLLQQFTIVILASMIAILGQYFFGNNSAKNISTTLILLYSVLNLSDFGPQYLGIEELLNRIRSGLKELEYGNNLAKHSNLYNLDTSTSKIQVNNIAYSYRSGQKIFENLNISFEKNKKNALIGTNGSGKSTLLKIISGFYVAKTGKIFFPYRTEPQIMYLPQNAPLFNRSIAENICYPNEDIDLNSINRLVKEIGLDSLINTISDLKNKTPGDFKNKISGGEEQKILILRAIVSKPQILLLDEITSELDERTIPIVYRMLDEYLPNITIISVVHRTEELKYYNNVVSIN